MKVSIGTRFFSELSMREVDTYQRDAYGTSTERQIQYDAFYESFYKPLKRTPHRVTVELTPNAVRYLESLKYDYNVNAGWDMDEEFNAYFMRTYPTWAEKIANKMFGR